MDPKNTNPSAGNPGQQRPAQTQPPRPQTPPPAQQSGARPPVPQGQGQQMPQGQMPGAGYPPMPPQGMPQGGFPPAGYPPMYDPYNQMPPQGFPPQGYPQQMGYYPPQGQMPGGYPPQGMPPQGFPPQGYPQGQMPQGGFPPAGYPPMPPQGYGAPMPPVEDTTPANFQLGTKFPPTLNVKAPKSELKYDDTYFIRLLAGSISLSKDEKKKIIESIPKLKQAQIDELIRIFEEEKQKFAALSKKHVPQLEKLAQQHFDEWMELEHEWDQTQKKTEDTSKADAIRKQLGI